MNGERDLSERAGPTVSVWTPWGEQRVPRAESRAASLGRMVKRLRDKEANESEGARLS